jgi:RNA polymerase subunit RPABC4/transcription elongation factor Spt4
MEEEKIDAGHTGLRNVFRILGPVIAVTGLIFIVVGLVSFFSAFGGFEPPRYFWCAFIGMPTLFVGLLLCKLGYMGKVARYVAGEIAPVGKDTINYMAKGTREGVKTVAQAIGEGLSAGGTAEQQTKVRCHKCNNLIEEAAKFCSKCGTALAKTKPCPTCKELNDPDAKFCDNCGFEFI